jgi:hypothetical protein
VKSFTAAAVKESIEVSLAQGQDGATGAIRQLAVIPAENSQDIGDLLQPEHRGHVDPCPGKLPFIRVWSHVCHESSTRALP